MVPMICSGRSAATAARKRAPAERLRVMVVARSFMAITVMEVWKKGWAARGKLSFSMVSGYGCGGSCFAHRGSDADAGVADNLAHPRHFGFNGSRKLLRRAADDLYPGAEIALPRLGRIEEAHAFLVESPDDCIGRSRRHEHAVHHA